MGYSYSTRAGLSLEGLFNVIPRGEGCGSNGFTRGETRYFFEETRRTRADGAITGTIYREIDETSCVPAGSVRIERNGTIARFPTTTREERAAAEDLGGLNFERICARGGE